MVAGQGKAGWNYEIEPVFAVAVTDFNFGHLSPKLIRDVMLTDKDSGEVLTDKVHIFFCSLKEVPDKWEECRTEIEYILFLIKNMESMDSTSLAYKEGDSQRYSRQPAATG
ncbi:MAG: Rpn family recombination-promoting nuclease/putative transposase [Muribaculaceae bacterium]|nr:Rpn family recombination-promoting nuclease/putative transposase [Muribaculaceae bacterium]